MGIRILRAKIPRQKIKDTSDFCTYCGIHLDDWQKVIDHFIPFSFAEGNANIVENLFVSCRECNAIKSNKYFEELEEARRYILEKKENFGKFKEKVCKNCGLDFYELKGKRLCHKCYDAKYFVTGTGTVVSRFVEYFCAYCHAKILKLYDKRYGNVRYCGQSCRRKKQNEANNVV